MGFDSQGDKKFFLEDVSEPQDDSQSSKKYKIIGYLTPDSGDNNSIKLTCPLLEGGLAPKNQTVLITETLILVSGWDQEDFFSLIDDNDQMAVLIMSSGDVLVQFGPVFVKNLQVLDLDGVSRKLENIEGFSFVVFTQEDYTTYLKNIGEKAFAIFASEIKYIDFGQSTEKFDAAERIITHNPEIEKGTRQLLKASRYIQKAPQRGTDDLKILLRILIAGSILLETTVDSFFKTAREYYENLKFGTSSDFNSDARYSEWLEFMNNQIVQLQKEV